MTIEGLENSTYYCYNPVWVRVSELSQQLTVRIGGSFTMYLAPIEGVVVFDIAKAVRALIPRLTNKTAFPFGGEVDGLYKIMFTFKADLDEDIKRYFIIGGQDKFTSNNSPQTFLSLSNYVWQGWPQWFSGIFDNKIKIADYSDFPGLPSTNILYPRHDCESIFFVFRNLKGGFSQYLFEDFVFEKSNKDLGHYLIRQTIKDSGSETTVNLTVRTKAIRGLYETLEHLGQSEEIYYRTKDNDTYIRLSGTNNVKFNQKNNTTDVQFSFEVVTNTVKSR